MRLVAPNGGFVEAQGKEADRLISCGYVPVPIPAPEPEPKPKTTARKRKTTTRK